VVRIRRIYDGVLPVNVAALEQVRTILAAQFSDLSRVDIQEVAGQLRDPFDLGLRPILFVAEDSRRKVLGFAIILHDPKHHFAFLNYIAAGPKLTGRGVGGALYERVRDECRDLDCRALLFECAPDDLGPEAPEALRRANVARLRFYERYGARPVINTDYQKPLPGTDAGDSMPFLVVDPLAGKEPIPAAWARRAVRTILERRYARLCPPAYVEAVSKSFRDPVLELRPYRYAVPERADVKPPGREWIALVVNDRHDIHHVRERGYVESPVRIGRILRALEPTGWFEQLPVKRFSVANIEAVHDRSLVRYIRRACREVGEGTSLYPYVFPIRNKARMPRERSVLAGYFCIDTFTPIHRNAYLAAKRAVDCTLTCAEEILNGRRIAYSLVRPPGHHAERSSFGGFCYFNNAAVAAHYLSRHGRVAILDIDYHHGNGQQDIFYPRSDVLTVSIHGHPSYAYPYFSGFEDETGEGPGEGFNRNLPLPERLDGAGYRKALGKALKTVEEFAPAFLVVSLGLDTAKGDPTGTWDLMAGDLQQNGELVGRLDLPTLVVQEGGYRTRTLGANARAFFRGLQATHDE
jgi:acetoin utilization deacetylase AcuC-like enzyme/GNAT superfamily N-acetyltransferase